MPTKSKAVKAKQEPVSDEPKKRRFSLNFLTKINIVYVLFILLIIASFLIGVLFTQVRYLEKGTTIGSTNDTYAANPAQPSQPTGPVDVSEGHLPIMGNKDAKVTLVEFSDFQCPFCEQLFKDAFPQIKKDYIDTGKVKLAYRHYPLTEIHPNAQKSAEASECANEQGNFWDYHDQLFNNQADWESLEASAALEKFVEYANEIGLNGETLRNCVESGKMADNISEDANDGLKVGVNGTPATFVNGMLVSGAVPYSEFKAEIDKALGE